MNSDKAQSKEPELTI